VWRHTSFSDARPSGAWDPGDAAAAASATENNAQTVPFLSGLHLHLLQMRLEAVTELGHSPSSNPPRGEVCVRGPMMFEGYYKQPDLTAQEVDADGFFHTGDIGELTPEGTLKIIDRKKNIFKLSQGECVLHKDECRRMLEPKVKATLYLNAMLERVLCAARCGEEAHGEV
jgi:acyl-CoA synthetase (AMP-forming)/AMP-acid ligase II